jgi:hypothetical protein
MEDTSLMGPCMYIEMEVIISLFNGVAPVCAILGDYLLSVDSAHLGARPSFPATRQLSLGGKCHKYWETADGRRYYGEIDSPAGFGVSTKHIWYDMATAEPRASQNKGEPVCWHDSGKLETPHRLGAPAWGGIYYVDGYRLPPEVGINFRSDTFYTMNLDSHNKLTFGPGPLHLKFTNGRLLIHGDAAVVPGHTGTRQIPMTWGNYQTVREWIAERTDPAFDMALHEYLVSKSKHPIAWGY